MESMKTCRAYGEHKNVMVKCGRRMCGKESLELLMENIKEYDN